MRPLLRLTLAAAFALALARVAEHATPHEQAWAAPLPSAATAAAPAPNAAPCPPGTLPDHGVCIPVPLEEPAAASSGEPTALDVQENEHHDLKGRLVRYEHIPRRPDRPADYRRYRLPVAIDTAHPFTGSGYDLDRPDAKQRRGSALKAVGHGGLDLVAERGTPVKAVPLEHQQGDAEVVYAGELFGTSVVTRHRVLEAGASREYIVIHGHLERAALRRGDAVKPGTVLGFVGDTGSPGNVHLHLEVRRVRDGVRVRELSARELVQHARTIVCDPRNVLMLRD